MKISKYNSSKITVLNTVLIMMVLYIHSYYLEGEQFPTVLALQRFFGGTGICGVANNLFFLLSGMLFFNRINSAKDCIPKIKKRSKTILVPYLIWNLVFVLWYIALMSVPGVDNYINSDILGNFKTPLQGIEFLWLSPASFPLWFLRDLICFVILSPVIYYCLKYLRWWWVVLYIFVSQFVPLHGWCFMLGGCISMNSNLEKLSAILTTPVVFVSAVVFIGLSLFVCAQSPEYHLNEWFVLLQTATGLVTVWKGYDYIAKGWTLNKDSFWSSIMGYSFFIYLFHEPVFNIVKKLNLKILGIHEWSLFMLYLTNPIIMACLAIVVAKILQRVIPRVYAVLVGGR